MTEASEKKSAGRLRKAGFIDIREKAFFQSWIPDDPGSPASIPNNLPGWLNPANHGEFEAFKEEFDWRRAAFGPGWILKGSN